MINVSKQHIHIENIRTQPNNKKKAAGSKSFGDPDPIVKPLSFLYSLLLNSRSPRD